MDDNNNLFVPVYSAKDEEEFIIAKTMLDNSGIEYNTRDEKLHQLWVGEKLRIDVRKENAASAREVLKDFIEGTAIPIDENEKEIFEKKNEFNFFVSIIIVSIVILLILLAVLFVK